MAETMFGHMIWPTGLLRQINKVEICFIKNAWELQWARISNDDQNSSSHGGEGLLGRKDNLFLKFIVDD